MDIQAIQCRLHHIEDSIAIEKLVAKVREQEDQKDYLIEQKSDLLEELGEANTSLNKATASLESCRKNGKTKTIIFTCIGTVVGFVLNAIIP